MGEEIVIHEHVFQAKWYLNGFPKSGLHWLVLMIRCIAQPQVEEELWTKPWAGTFEGNSWTGNKAALEKVLYKIGRLQDGRYLKGHAGYSDEMERFLYYLGAAHVFLYRDLRDVAVSQAFHVISPEDELKQHPEKWLYQDMDSFEDVLRAVIVGAKSPRSGVYFPGVMARWQHYAPWLDVDWTYQLRYEDMHNRPQEVIGGLLEYGLGRCAPMFGCKLNVNREVFNIVVDLMIESGQQTDKAATFRKGAIGDWREHFTPELAQLFAMQDRAGWLVQLGYERDEDWWKRL